MRAILAVVLGVVLWGGLWTGAQAVLSGALPDAFDADGLPLAAGMLIAFLAWSVVLSGLAGYVAAWITRSKPMRVVTILAAIQLLIGIAVQVGAWERKRNAANKPVNWQFTTDDARIKLKRLYPQFEA